MADLATLLLQRGQLESARASAELRHTSSDGRTVQFKSGQEIEVAIAAVDRDIALLLGDSRPSITRAVISRG